MEKKCKKKTFLRILKKKLKIRYILLLIILLSSNTFAWFIYTREVESDLTVKVRAWKVSFEAGDQVVESLVNINVEDVYPGMTTFKQNVTASNFSDMDAKLEYTILKANIMGDEFITDAGKINDGLELTGAEMTSSELEVFLINNYPFIISFEVAKAIIPIDEQSNFIVNVAWAYESGNDAADTYWGNRAYDYRKANPNSSCITMQIRLNITQADGS